jgi:small subunit ribosomal protein S7
MRRRRAKKRKIPPDMVYGSELVSKFINSLMWDGKKYLAEKIFYNALKIVEQKTKNDGLTVFLKAIDNVKPIVEVRPRRVGGATYQVPIEVRPDRQISLAIRWIIQTAREKKGKPMSEKLAEELITASEGRGGAWKKKEDTHKMAEANKAFAHFKW